MNEATRITMTSSTLIGVQSKRLQVKTAPPLPVKTASSPPVKMATLILGFATIKSRFAATFESVSYKNCSRDHMLMTSCARTSSFVRVDEYIINLN